MTPDAPEQLSLLSTRRTRGRFRKNGGSTQRRGGESMNGAHLRDLQMKVLLATVEWHRRLCIGANAWEVSCVLHDRGVRAPAINSIGSRFDELVDEGMVWHPLGLERKGETNRQQQVFKPTEAGRLWAEAWFRAHPRGLAELALERAS